MFSGCLKENSPAKKAGLYIHVPFCIRKCSYCDFYSVEDLSLETDYVKSVIKEMALVKHDGLVFDTLYFGGGTPSALKPENIEKLINAAKDMFDFELDSEITLELNPGSIAGDELMQFRESGVNRLNIGIQSFDDKALELLGRIHTSDDAVKIMEQARAAGFENIGIDLMFGIPNMTKGLWINQLEKGVSLKPEHISAYMLTYEHGTPLEKLRESGSVNAPSDDDVADLFQITSDYLTDNGFEHYEISNFARVKEGSTFRSRHNGKYWSFAPYIGLGPSAHSFNGVERSWNCSDILKYIRMLKESVLPVEEKETLSEDQLIIETIYLGLRKSDGIDIERFEKSFGKKFQGLFGDIIEDLKKRGWLDTDSSKCSLTRTGMLFLDSVASMFIKKF